MYYALLIFGIAYISIVWLRRKSRKILVIIGSGGHTAEMVRMLPIINAVYILNNNDTKSKSKLPTRSNIVRIPRPRNVKQSWLTTILTTLYSFIYSLYLSFILNPKLLICNGPGTCVPIALASFFLTLVKLNHTKLLYIESLARVQGLSMTGRILYPFSDRFIVQWKELLDKYPKAEYHGRLV